MEKQNNHTVALELPTGSGKTLVGLLIGEYRRRKNKEKVLFLCPTNQLVNQVVEQANVKYGLNTIAFCGKQKNYLPIDKTNFQLAKKIGVTTYSSFFAQYSFFDDVDIIIMDDVHSCEDYIISNWTIKIDKDKTEFLQIAKLIQSIISENDYQYLTGQDDLADSESWCNLVPAPLLSVKVQELNSILRVACKKGAANFYAYLRISENLQECNMFISKGSILIRPWIAPTWSCTPYSKAKQKILMSATLGRSGELERITGIENICRLPIVNDWDKKGLGRKFFIFPDLSLGPESYDEVIVTLHNLCKKSVFLVPNVRSVDSIRQLFANNLQNSIVLTSSDIEISKANFTDNLDATVVLANRFDGIDFPDEECRLLFIWNLPKTTNIQERFLISRMGASKLYAERIRTRIIQAVGRCSRNPSDYSIVCVIGNTIQNDLTKREKIQQFPPELHAELEFGLENSMEYSSVKDLKIQAKDFLSRNQNWQEAEDYIVDLRNSYSDDEDNAIKHVNKKLEDASIYELKYQCALWKKDYQKAYEATCSIVALLNAPALSGYKSFWNYLSGSMAYYLYKNGKIDFKAIGIKCFADALQHNTSVRWLSSLSEEVFSIGNSVKDNDMFFDIIERMETKFTEIASIAKMEQLIKQIIENLKSPNGKAFEQGHKELGALLGYISENFDSTGAPDPYWIINSQNLIVSEDKIYTEKEQIKDIPISDVSEAGRHETWILNNEKRIVKDANIISVLISNSNSIDEAARIYAGDIYYLSRNDFVDWAINATTVIRSAMSTFVDGGDGNWRESVYQMFLLKNITPLDYLKLITKQKLTSLKKTHFK